MTVRTIRVLLVDDSESDCFLISALLAEITHTCFLVESVRGYQAGLETIRRGEHDVCLVDYRLGADCGIDLIREAVQAGTSMPLVLLTGYGGPEVDEEALEAGATGYLDKQAMDSAALDRVIRYAVESPRRLARRQQKAIFEALHRLWSVPHEPHAAIRPSAASLRESHGALFEDFVATYATLLELALENRLFRVEHDVSAGLQRMAQRLADFRATPRDVIEIHYAATKQKTAAAAGERALATVEEGNLMVLELMGFLASCYRAQAGEKQPAYESA